MRKRIRLPQHQRGTTLIEVLVAILVTAIGVMGAAAFSYLAVMAVLLRGATGMMFRVVESNEWSRFHTVDIAATIRDHVGEDKLQIVTFRDRNRFE